MQTAASMDWEGEAPPDPTAFTEELRLEASTPIKFTRQDDL